MITMITMEKLPVEIIFKILCYCQVRDVLNISLTSSTFKYYIDCENLWNVLLKRDYPYDWVKVNPCYDCSMYDDNLCTTTLNRLILLDSENAKDNYKYIKCLSPYIKLSHYIHIDKILRDLLTIDYSPIEQYAIVKECEAKIKLEKLKDQCPRFKGSIKTLKLPIDTYEKIVKECEAEINAMILIGECPNFIEIINKVNPFFYEKIKPFDTYDKILLSVSKKIMGDDYKKNCLYIHNIEYKIEILNSCSC